VVSGLLVDGLCPHTAALRNLRQTDPPTSVLTIRTNAKTTSRLSSGKVHQAGRRGVHRQGAGEDASIISLVATYR
jgi:hypothetical protein